MAARAQSLAISGVARSAEGRRRLLGCEPHGSTCEEAHD